jgi:hypothetical protein
MTDSVSKEIMLGIAEDYDRLGRVLINPVLLARSLNVRFAPKATELLRRREMTGRARGGIWIERFGFSGHRRHSGHDHDDIERDTLPTP